MLESIKTFYRLFRQFMHKVITQCSHNKTRVTIKNPHYINLTVCVTENNQKCCTRSLLLHEEEGRVTPSWHKIRAVNRRVTGRQSLNTTSSIAITNQFGLHPTSSSAQLTQRSPRNEIPAREYCCIHCDVGTSLCSDVHRCSVFTHHPCPLCLC